MVPTSLMPLFSFSEHHPAQSARELVNCPLSDSSSKNPESGVKNGVRFASCA